MILRARSYFYLDNGDIVSTPEIEADSYKEVFGTFYEVDELGMINIELEAESIFIPANKISRIKVTNDTEVAEKMGVGFISF
ncbi:MULTISPECIES: hypothetical protein [unclassified Lysinibacillus]|uniref:hypothetical protein n=1 Tax=unclassified Lysinibacillus TaxID=2636778 RepID=UPI003805A571